MKNLFLTFVTSLLTFQCLFSQVSSGSAILGKQWQNGMMISSSDGGCDIGCYPTYCTPITSGNGSDTESNYTVSVPAGHFMVLRIFTNVCSTSNPPSHGLDNNEDFYVNSIKVVDGFGNTNVDYEGCFQNNGTSVLEVLFSFNANRRDETVTAEWDIFDTDPGIECVAAIPLPIQMKSFELVKKQNSNTIHFSTASETNNDFFTIERSVDGRNFVSVGEIKGAGNSHETLSYEFIDEKPLAGINYYRIKQTDFDSKYLYSEIKSVRHISKGNLTVTPRTTEGRLQVVTDIEDYTLEVFNASGQLVKSFTTLSADQSISIDELEAGLYFVRIHHGSEVETVKITKI
jgi:hypothetical protein